MNAAVRRNTSNVSCEDFGRVLTSDISASTVARSEMRAGAGLIASAQFFLPTNAGKPQADDRGFMGNRVACIPSGCDKWT